MTEDKRVSVLEEVSEATVRLFFLFFFLALLFLYTVSSFFPNSFLWGVNHLAFMSPTQRIVVLLAALMLGIPFVSKKYLHTIEATFRRLTESTMKVTIASLVAGAVAGLIFYRARIITDMYGDTRTLLEYLARKSYSLADLFRFDDREPLTRFLHQTIAHVFTVDQKLTYQIVSAATGALYVATLCFFVMRLHGSAKWKLLVLIIGLTAGANQLFFGHVEDYTLVYCAILLFLLAAWMLFEGKNTLPVMLILFIVGMRLHLEVVLLLPALVYAILYSLQRRHPGFVQWLEPKRVAAAVAASVVCATLAYFFYFHADHSDVGDAQERAAKIFLPLMNPLPAPHEYTLFSLNHCSDVIQEFLLTISPASMLVLGAAVLLRRRVDWKAPHVMFLGLAAFYFLLFNFTVNPLLTMPRDWDFLALAAAPVTFLAIALSKQLFHTTLTEDSQSMLGGVALGLAVVSCTFFYINADNESIGKRERGIGQWAYESYYWGSSYVINVGEKMIEDRSTQIAERERTIRELIPDASVPDFELGVLYYWMGDALYRQKDFSRAFEYFSNALKNDQGNASALKSLALLTIQNRDFDEGSRIIAFYNKNLNHPKVVDFEGLLIAERCNYFRYLKFVHADSMYVQKKLDDLFETTKE